MLLVNELKQVASSGMLKGFNFGILNRDSLDCLEVIVLAFEGLWLNLKIGEFGTRFSYLPIGFSFGECHCNGKMRQFRCKNSILS